MEKKYTWWDDPKNQDEVKRVSWWNHDENKKVFHLPISVIKSDQGWVATCNDETKIFLGDKLHGCGQGKTKNEAIKEMFEIIRITHDFEVECSLNYQRWVPFIKGNWKRIGGSWFTIFGLNIYFRYGKRMKGGSYIPFTKLNISISNQWKTFRTYIKNRP